jgi:hypothetical protein
MFSPLRTSGWALAAITLFGPTLAAQDRAADEEDRLNQARMKRLEMKLERAVTDPEPDGTGRLRFVAVRKLAVEEKPPDTQEAGSDPDGWAGEDDHPQDRPPQGVPVDFQGQMLSSICFDIWLFGNMDTEELRGRWLSQILEEEIARLGGGRNLTEAQKAKLRLAGKGDIKRFYAKVGRVRQEYEAARQDVRQGLVFLQRLQRSLGQEFQDGPFRGESLLIKTYRTMTW